MPFQELLFKVAPDLQHKAVIEKNSFQELSGKWERATKEIMA